jgi:hypothetical protein
MPQDQESGAAAAKRGHLRAAGIARLLGAVKPKAGSNAVLWNGERAVIKSCRPGTSSIGITPGMEPELDSVLAAIEDKFGDVQIVRVAIADFRRVMYDGVARPGAEPLKMMRRAEIERLGRPVQRLKLSQIETAGSAERP